MAKLHQAQRDAIAAFALAIEVEGENQLGPWESHELDQIFRRIGKQSPWKEYLEEKDILRTIFWLLYRCARPIPSNYRGKLREAPDGERMIIDFQDQLVEYFESIPRSYFVYFPLVGVPEILTPEHKLTNSIALIDTSIREAHDPRLMEESSLSLAAAISGRQSSRLIFGQRYLRILVSGYADGTTTTSAAILALAQLKHFLFFGLATGLFMELPLWISRRHDSSLNTPAIVIRHTSIDEDEVYVLSLPEEFYRYLLRLNVRKDGLKYYDNVGAKTLLGGTLRAPNSPEEIALTLLEEMRQIGKFLDVSPDDPDAVRIKAASEWWIDANASQNQTISFLQFCIGFEALLGENSPDRGITERLADRYAFLLGKTQSQRSELRDKFRNVYKRRGNIVHQREPHLRRSDSVAREDARQMLSRAILIEIGHLMKAKN